VENDLFINIWSWNTENATNIFQNYKAKRNIFPKESSIQIENDFAWILRIFGNHWKWNSTVTQICIEYTFER